MTPLAGDGALLERRIVEPAAQAKDTPKLPLLGRSRDQFVLIGLAEAPLFHRYLVSLIGAKPEGLKHALVLSGRLKPGGMRRAKPHFCSSSEDDRTIWRFDASNQRPLCQNSVIEKRPEGPAIK
jgi:hypothetical protein